MKQSFALFARVQHGGQTSEDETYCQRVPGTETYPSKKQTSCGRAGCHICVHYRTFLPIETFKLWHSLANGSSVGRLLFRRVRFCTRFIANRVHIPVLTMRLIATTCARSAGKSAILSMVAASERACSGSGWTSRKRASTPTATAARVRCGTYSRKPPVAVPPAPAPGRCTLCVPSNTTG